MSLTYTYLAKVACLVPLGLQIQFDFALYLINVHISLFFPAPSSPPLGLSVDVLSPYSLMVSWSQPPIEERNGEIVHYTVTVETGANVTHWDTRDLEMILELLHPNYEYHISVAATTVAQGPYSPELSITMPEARKTQMLFVTCS